MTKAPLPFEPTNSWCYNFARYQALPEILALPEVAAGEPFRLVELSKRVLDLHLTREQQESTYIRAQTGTPATIAHTTKFLIDSIARRTGQLLALGSGMFRLPTPEDVDEEEVEEALAEAGEEDTTESQGWIYAFSFPDLVKDDGRYPIKIGKTTLDVEARVIGQCRQSATFDRPTILGSWKVVRVGAVESAIHLVLRARGQWREQALGTEWFNTRVDEIVQIIDFVTQGRVN